jgi:hypothetical protein
MKQIIILVMLLMINSCARKVDVQAPNVVLTQRYAYIKTEDGRVYIVTSNTTVAQPGIVHLDPLANVSPHDATKNDGCFDDNGRVICSRVLQLP